MHRIFSRIRSCQPAPILLALTLVAALLRFYKLGEWSFWGDEAFSLTTKVDGFITPFSTRLIHTTTALLGASEWSARLVPALVGIATIPVFFFCIRRLFGNNAACIASALLAVSTWHIYW